MSQQQTTPMDDGEIDLDSDHDPCTLETPAVIWAEYVGINTVQYIKQPKNQTIGTSEMRYVNEKSISLPTFSC